MPGLAEEADSAQYGHQDDGDDQTQDAEDGTGDGHTFLLHKAGGVGHGVGRGGNRQSHTQRGGEGYRDQQGDSTRVVHGTGGKHGTGHTGQNGHQQGSRGGVAHEGGHEEADAACTDEQHGGVPLAEGNGANHVLGQIGLTESHAECETTGNQPEHIPAHGSQVFLRDNTCHGEHGDGDDSHGVGIKPVILLGDNPHEDGDDESGVHHDGLGRLEELALKLLGEVQTGLGDGEHLDEDNPAHQQHDNHKGNAEGHPLAEGYIQAEVLHGLKGDGVGRCADGSADATHVRTNRDAEGKGGAAAVLRFEESQHGGEQGEHHGGGGRVAHEHGEDGSHAHQAQQHILGISAEGLEQYASQIDVQTVFGGGICQEETTEEEDDDGVGEGSEDTPLLGDADELQVVNLLAQLAIIESGGSGQQGGLLCLVSLVGHHGLENGRIDGGAHIAGAQGGLLLHVGQHGGLRGFHSSGIGAGAIGIGNDGLHRSGIIAVDLEEVQRLVRHAQQGECDNQHGGGPNRNGLQNPHEGGENEQGDDSRLDNIDGHTHIFKRNHEHAAAQEQHDNDFNQAFDGGVHNNGR